MSISSPYSQRVSSNKDAQCTFVPKGQPKENCRDYLRTGRCKYGASCKYHHPSNVQSGGGMKAPIDPSEPMFPIRYNEPECQYYMKHGTCKFGQACKFHHPPQVAETGVVVGSGGSCVGGTNTINNGKTLLVSIPLNRNTDGTQTVWKASGNDSDIQLLPQRPDEPNCLYFLKNGRCKYGASCRYHHPLNYSTNNERRNGGMVEGSRTRQQHSSAPKVHYVTALPPGSMQQGHFVVADGTVTFLSLDGNAPAHVVSIPQSATSTTVSGTKDGTSLYTVPGTIASSVSSTSIASSFETPPSNIDNHDSSAGSVWSRKLNGNNAASAAYNLPRVVSTGNTQKEDGNSFMLYLSNESSRKNGHPAWSRGKRSSSFDYTRIRSSSLSSSLDKELPRSASVQSGLNDKSRQIIRSPTRGAPYELPGSSMIMAQNLKTQQRSNGEVDDGLSKMTSALLTMIDTPEEADGNVMEARRISCDYDQHRIRSNTTSSPLSNGCQNQPIGYCIPQQQKSQASANKIFSSSYKEELNMRDSRYFGSFAPIYHTEGQHSQYQDHVNQMDRIQSWLGSASAGVIHEDSLFSSIDQPAEPSSSLSNSSNNFVGLFY